MRISKNILKILEAEGTADSLYYMASSNIHVPQGEQKSNDKIITAPIAKEIRKKKRRISKKHLKELVKNVIYEVYNVKL